MHSGRSYIGISYSPSASWRQCTLLLSRYPRYTIPPYNSSYGGGRSSLSSVLRITSEPHHGHVQRYAPLSRSNTMVDLLLRLTLANDLTIKIPRPHDTIL